MPRIRAIGTASVDIITQVTEYPAEDTEVCARVRALETDCRLAGCKCAPAGFAGLENA
jgi:hypothetical protein